MALVHSGNGSESGVLPGSMRRSLTDICFDILNTLWVEGDAKPTQLMYKTNLSWTVLTNLVDYLGGRGLVSTRQVGSRRTISLTPIGKVCLQRLSEVRALLLAGPEDNKEETFPFVAKRALSFSN